MHAASTEFEGNMQGRQAGLAAMWAAATLATVLVSGEAQAARIPQVDRAFVADRGPIAVEVVVAGRATPLFMASNRQDRWYLEARQGRKYEIKVRNTTGERVGFVLAVDGLNAIDGTLSRNASGEPMYVLDPWASSTIKGWRRNLDQVSRFVFVDERRSYAERTGQGNGDLGWIRVTAFHEVWTGRSTWGSIRSRYHEDGDGSGERKARDEAQEAPPSADSRARVGNGAGAQGSPGDISSQAPSAPMDEPSNPGTGWGPNQRDRVRQVDFTPRAHAAAQVILRYEYKPALVA
ncbi:MAG: hypothetical protein ABIP29_12350, partial [Candidatus Eisenbacteria bacterium]